MHHSAPISASTELGVPRGAMINRAMALAVWHAAGTQLVAVEHRCFPLLVSASSSPFSDSSPDGSLLPLSPICRRDWSYSLVRQQRSVVLWVSHLPPSCRILQASIAAAFHCLLQLLGQEPSSGSPDDCKERRNPMSTPVKSQSLKLPSQAPRECDVIQGSLQCPQPESFLPFPSELIS